ncbi:YidC/Oxa1 family membrane protein insertase [Patescibacteria group bacterium]|nr:YidC/Oxa1 family membrane protein insertase [Patescibacteria group bacterium]MBU1028710.1 YidC/Oxa1 family membrane protein insertase [Patescibacteria group bacterium]
MLIDLYHAILYEPIFNVLVGLYNILPGHDIGIAIIIMTILIKLVLWPLQSKALKSQKALQDIQPKVQELKKKYPNKEDQEKMAKELMSIYSKEKVNPLSSCLPLLIQIPVFIALYRALSHGLESTGFEALYSFVGNPGTIEPSMFGLVDLANRNIALAVLAAIAQYFQAKMMITRQQPKKTPGAQDEQMMASMNKSMVYMMPGVTLFIGIQMPGGLALYWLTMTLLMIIQQYIFFKKKKAVEVVEQESAKS